MNGNMYNSSSSYCRRHIYSKNGEPMHGRDYITTRKSCIKNNKVICDNNKKAFGFNALKSQYDKFKSSVTDKDTLNQTISKVGDWLEVDNKALRIEGVKVKFPIKLIVSIVVVATSLMLIVSGAVISSKSNMELYAAENRLNELLAYNAELDAKLELKNDLVYIEDVARNRLGMIDRKYGTVSYLDSNVEDAVEIYEQPTDKSAFYVLLNALGFFGE